jgi:hypothetical protein
MNANVKETLYACSLCAAPLRVVNSQQSGGDPAERRAFAAICTKCGHHVNDVAQEQYFLRVTACSEVLWAKNARHLAHIKTFVSADSNRPHNGGHLRGSCYCCHQQGLPTWMLLASNREKVLKAIAKLEEKLKDAGIKVDE